MHSELSIYDNAKKSVSLLLEIDDVKDHMDKAQAVAEHMRRAGDNEMATKAAKYKMYCERQAGILLKQMEKAKGAEGNPNGRGAKIVQYPEDTAQKQPKTLSEMGISKKQSSQFQKLASIDEDKFDEVIEKQVEHNVIPNRSQTLKMASGAHVSNNSGNNEWYTPEHIIYCAREVMGSIDLDPATSLIANQTVKASKIFTEDDSGLDKEWLGNVWMNPPYAQPLINEFSEKLCSEVLKSNITKAIVLVNNATETKWFQSMLDISSAVCFPLGRIKFVDPDGNPSGAPLQGQAILYFGENVHVFSEWFSDLGKVVYCEIYK